MTLSIIVPVYNVAPYLSKCVDSLLAQDLPASDYEIILVDDGSPDECPQICDSYANSYDNICVVHQENGGLSAARNTGIATARGIYVCFIDSDDYIEPNVVSSLIKRMDDEHLDALRYNFQNVRLVNGEYEVFEPFKAAKRDMDYSESITDGETFLNTRLGPSCYATHFILRRDILNDCLFTEGIFFEDTDWTPRMLLKCKRVSSTSRIVYNYLWRNGSITLPTDPRKREKVLHDKMSLVKGFKEQQQLVNDPIWFIWMTSFTTMTILDMLSVMPSSKRKPYLKELKMLHIFPLMTKKEKMLLHKVKIMLANISPALYCTLMHLRK